MERKPGGGETRAVRYLELLPPGKKGGARVSPGRRSCPGAGRRCPHLSNMGSACIGGKAVFLQSDSDNSRLRALPTFRTKEPPSAGRPWIPPKGTPHSSPGSLSEEINHPATCLQCGSQGSAILFPSLDPTLSKPLVPPPRPLPVCPV